MVCSLTSNFGNLISRASSMVSDATQTGQGSWLKLETLKQPPPIRSVAARVKVNELEYSVAAIVRAS